MDCIALGAEDGALVASKPVYGGGVLGEFVIHGSPRMATVRVGTFAPHTGGAAAADIRRIEVPAPTLGRVKFLDEASAPAASGPKLKDAKIIISGGRGLGGADNWHLIEQAAEATGAAVGCSRPVADAGWTLSSHQVGLSGTMVSPDLYIAVGISGAVQHLAGIGAAKTVVAINNDPEAEIFTRADYGVVGDCREVLPAFVKQLKQLRSGS
jgi:electron transfer flavoprotein alpha subunit